jgi:hypothetical protein
VENQQNGMLAECDLLVKIISRGSVSTDLRKTILGVLDLAEFLHGLGQQRTCRPRNPTSVLPPRPDIADQAGHVGLVPRSDIGHLVCNTSLIRFLAA